MQESDRESIDGDSNRDPSKDDNLHAACFDNDVAEEYQIEVEPRESDEMESGAAAAEI